MYDIIGYYEAETVSEATALLAENPKLRLIAGGTDLLIKMRGGQIEDVELLSLRKIKSLGTIRKAEDGTIVRAYLHCVDSPHYKGNLLQEKS